MLELVEAACRDAERRGVTGRPLLWRFARAGSDAARVRFLHVDEAVRRGQHGAAPGADDTRGLVRRRGRAGGRSSRCPRARPCASAAGSTGSTGRRTATSGRGLRLQDRATRPSACRCGRPGARRPAPCSCRSMPTPRALTGADRRRCVLLVHPRRGPARRGRTGSCSTRPGRRASSRCVDAIVAGVGPGLLPGDPGDRDYDPYAYSGDVRALLRAARTTGCARPTAPRRGSASRSTTRPSRLPEPWRTTE